MTERIHIYPSGPFYVAELPGEFRREYTDKPLAVRASLSWAVARRRAVEVVDGKPGETE